jgi:hypothetical protein
VAAGKWPVIGERLPRDDRAPWHVSISGLVEQPLELSLNELRRLPYCQRQVDIHCVTRWSKLGARFGGVLLKDLLQQASVQRSARFIRFVARSARAHSTSLKLDDAIALNTLLALDYDDSPLPVEHGGPLRVVTPGRYFYKSLKWLERIELLAVDQLGYWEQVAGYHNAADPWLQQRYIATQLSRPQLEAILRQRDFSGLDLLNLEASGRNLAGLIAREALLRNADFRDCRLEHACFERANLSNAHFRGADLRGASFRDADVEGADFSGANLRGADFRGASLIGATFFDEQAGFESASTAALDGSTQIERASLAQLTPNQAALIERLWATG